MLGLPSLFYFLKKMLGSHEICLKVSTILGNVSILLKCSIGRYEVFFSHARIRIWGLERESDFPEIKNESVSEMKSYHLKS